MRQLKPEVVEQRKRHLLQWIVHYYIKTSKPVSSGLIAEEAGLDLSSATIRNILQDLEDEGFLAQPHTSAGREPTDKGYRFFVDYLSDVQRLAAGEKERIEEGYNHRIEELDTLMVETSRLLSQISQSAGIVLSPQVKKQTLRRLELIPLGGHNVLGVMVTDAGMVRHWPITLGFAPSTRQLQVLNNFLNAELRGVAVDKAKAAVAAKLGQLEREFSGMADMAAELMREVGMASPDSLYIEGADNILSQADQFGDLRTVQSLMRVIGQKDRLAEVLEREITEAGKDNLPSRVRVRIGEEAGLPELGGRLSLVTRTSIATTTASWACSASWAPNAWNIRA